MAVWERRALLGIAFAAAACTGQVGSGEEESAESAGTLFPEVGLPPPALSPASIPRLTTAQYAQVMRDLFGAGIPLSTLEEDTRPGFFSVLGAAQTAASERTVSRFGAAAQEIARAVFEDPDRRTAVVACAAGSPPPPACAAEFLRRFGARAWRRPLTPEELGRYQDLFRFSAQGDPWRGLRYAVEAMLQSPYFLYRVERGTPDGDTPGHLKHDPWEIASRLAFLIRGGLPDAELNEAAASGALTEAEGVRAEAARLFDADDAGARAGLEHFLGEYLGFDEAARVPFPSGLASPGLRGSARAELEARVSDLLEKGRDYRTLFTSPGTFLNEDLARLYDVQGVTGAALRPVTLPESSPRAGLLTAAGILTRDPREERTSPTSRGVWVRMRLLCGEVEDPPPGIPKLEQSVELGNETVRQLIERHMSDADCQRCHVLTDPLGLGLEDFDQFGRHRTAYADGARVDAASELDGVPFVGGRQLGERLAQQPELALCLVRQLFQYGLARTDGPGDKLTLHRLTNRFARQGYSLRALLLDFVGSDTFRYAKGETP